MLGTNKNQFLWPHLWQTLDSKERAVTYSNKCLSMEIMYILNH